MVDLGRPPCRFPGSSCERLRPRLRMEYNTRRPHSALGYRPPAPETLHPSRRGCDINSLIRRGTKSRSGQARSAVVTERPVRRDGIFFLGVRGQSGRKFRKWRGFDMRKLGLLAVCLIFGAGLSAAQDLVSIIHGTIKKVDHATKTIVVKTADGTEHTIKVTSDDTIKGTKDGFEGLKEGTEVVARTTGKGVDETAVDVGKVSKDGFKVTKGTVTKFDKDTKTISVKAADGTVKTFELSGKALDDAGKATGKGVEKGAKVTVYYTEEGGKKTAHFLAE
jgi:hypothetical protein